MDKLSSILPSSPRVQNVDMTDAQPVRPGAPTFGRPQGISTVKDRFSVSQEAKDIAFKDTLAVVNPKEAHSAKIADDMTKKFFEQKSEIKAAPGNQETQERQMDIAESMPRAAQAKVEGPSLSKEAGTKEAPAKSGARLDLEA